MASRHEGVQRRLVRLYRGEARRPMVRVQVDRVLADLDRLRVLTARGDSAIARGAALATAKAALVLSVTPAANQGDRSLRREVLREEVVPALHGVGLDHVGPLIEAALALDVDPAVVARAPKGRQ